MAGHGWYADPVDPSLQRYWDGWRWTHEHRSTSDGPPVPIGQAHPGTAAVVAGPVPTPTPMPMSAPVAGAPGPTAVAAPGAVRALVPSWSRRGIALAIDTVAVYGVPALISMGVTGTTTVAPAGLVVSVVLLLIDLVIVQGITGQSLGKWAAAIAVVDPDSRQPVGIVRAAVRTVVSIFTIVVFLVVVLYDFQRLTTRGTRLCDSAARTVVVPAAERQPRSP